MSRYRLISGFRMLELLVVSVLIALLTGLALSEYRTYIHNSFSGNFIGMIQNAKTQAMINTAFSGIEIKKKIIHTENASDDYSPFKKITVDSKGKITLFTPDKDSNFWYQDGYKTYFSERELSMYIHRTGSEAYGFSYLSCDPLNHDVVNENVLKIDRSYYQYYCQ